MFSTVFTMKNYFTMKNLRYYLLFIALSFGCNRFDNKNMNTRIDINKHPVQYNESKTSTKPKSMFGTGIFISTSTIFSAAVAVTSTYTAYVVGGFWPWLICGLSVLGIPGTACLNYKLWEEEKNRGEIKINDFPSFCRAIPKYKYRIIASILISILSVSLFSQVLTIPSVAKYAYGKEITSHASKPYDKLVIATQDKYSKLYGYTGDFNNLDQIQKTAFQKILNSQPNSAQIIDNFNKANDVYIKIQSMCKPAMKISRFLQIPNIAASVVVGPLAYILSKKNKVPNN